MDLNLNSSLITSYFPELSSVQLTQLISLGPLYEDWNRRLNLISRKDIEKLYERHVLHSLAIAKWNQIKAGGSILDLGTGGGFPGIPLAIYYPNVSFTLVDSTRKKLDAVKDIVGHIHLSNVETKHARAESLQEKFDHIVVRAVADTSIIIRWALPLLRHSRSANLILLKGGDLSEELISVRKRFPVSEIQLSQYYTESFFNSKTLVIISPFQKGVQT